MIAVDLKALLARVASEILEESAFLFLEPLEGDAPAWPSGLLVADLPLHHPEETTLRVAVAPEVGSRLAEEILGQASPGEDGKKRALDALAEVANMTGGLFLERFLGPDEDWELGLPEVRSMEKGEYLEESKRSVSRVLLSDEEGSLVEVSLFTRME